MKLTLEFIQLKLNTGTLKLYPNTEEKPEFSGVRLFVGGQVAGQERLEPTAAYVGSWQDVKSLSPGALPHNFICAAPEHQPPPSNLTSNLTSNLLWVQGESTPTLFNRVQQILDNYQRLEDALLDAILSEAPLQSILDCCVGFFDNPVYIVDSAMKLVLYSSNLPESELGPAWLDTLASGFTSVKVMNALRRADLLEKLNNAPDPVLIDLDGITPPWLTANIFENNTRIASVGVAALLHPVSTAHLGLLKHITRLLTTILNKRHNLAYVRSAGNERFLIDLLTGAPMDEAILSHHLSRIGWKSDGDFFLMKILPAPQDLSGGTIEYSGKMVGSFFEESRMVVLGDYLVIIANVTGRRQTEIDRTFSRLNTFLKKRKLACGVSLKFHCFSNLYAQYQLAAAALDIGSKIKGQTALFPYEAYVTAHLFKSSESLIDLRMLCHPEISKLESYDRQNNSDLLPTLYTYLTKERSLVTSAHKLNIHRNTLVYRINKINGIINTNLDDDRNRRHLILSCEILGYLKDKYAGPAEVIHHQDPIK